LTCDGTLIKPLINPNNICENKKKPPMKIINKEKIRRKNPHRPEPLLV
jgi:hypothetical protein